MLPSTMYRTLFISTGLDQWALLCVTCHLTVRCEALLFEIVVSKGLAFVWCELKPYIGQFACEAVEAAVAWRVANLEGINVNKKPTINTSEGRTRKSIARCLAIEFLFLKRLV